MSDVMHASLVEAVCAGLRWTACGCGHSDWHPHNEPAPPKCGPCFAREMREASDKFWREHGMTTTGEEI